MFASSPISIRTLLLAFPCLVMCNCTAQHTLVSESPTNALAAQSDPIIEVLSELAIISIASTPQQPLGPNLVAGDSLAWQCADAGDYWNLPLKNAPTLLYAGAYEAEMSGSDFEY